METRHKTWDQALLRRLRARPRLGGLFAAPAVVALVVGLLPGVAHAHFDPDGSRIGGAQLDAPDSAVSGAGVPPNLITVRGRYFVPSSAVALFQCIAGETDPLHNCVAAGASVTDGNGEFSAQIQPQIAFVSPAGKDVNCNAFHGVAFNGDDTLAKVYQCAVVAATYNVFGEPTSMAEHLLCLSSGVGFCTTNRDGTPTTTTTLPPPTGEWQPAASMNVPRRNLATAVGLDGRIYALGGTSAPYEGIGGPFGEALDSAEVFDPCGRRTWSPIARMPTARTQFAAATGPDGRIYAIGGYAPGTPLVGNGDGEVQTATVDAYDPVTNTWSSVAPLPMARSDLAAATGPDGRIYAIGGNSSAAGPFTVEAYDPATNQWTEVTPSPDEHSGPQATTGPDGRVYAIVVDKGAFSGVGSGNDSYSPGPGDLPGTWRSEAAPVHDNPADKVTGGAVVTGPTGLIYAIGGYHGVGDPTFPGVWIFDTTSQTWRLSDEAMTIGRQQLAAATGRDGRIYAIGGVNWVNSYPYSSPAEASTESARVAPSSCPASLAPADFDGNHLTDYSVFRPSSGTWFAKDGVTTGWGIDGDIPVPADYDGDLKVDVAVFRPSNGVWFVKDGQTLAYGTQGDIPVPADYDGDGKADIAVFRPSNGVWFIHYSSGGDAAFAWGASGDVAVPADYDGDKKADIAVFRDGVWYIHPASGAPDITVNYGTAGDIPVVADYDADHTADVAVFRPSTGSWFLRHSGDGAEEAFAWGAAGDIPVPGEYGSPNSPIPDGIADAAVFRPSSGTWFTELGTVANWGVGTDIPLPLPAAVRMAYFH